MDRVDGRTGRLYRCWLQRLCDRRGRRTGSQGPRRNEHHAQLGYLDPTILPGEAEARKPKFLPAEVQVQQQRVNHQGKQQRKSQSPVFRACEMAPPQI